MSVHRSFFVPAGTIDNGSAKLSGPLVHQMKDVLRLVPGDHVSLLDNSGWRYDVEITALDRDHFAGEARGKTLVATEPRTKITLHQGLLRLPQFELVLQKATEVGVSVIVPTVCQHCVVSHIANVGGHKIERWERILAEAAEQSGRGRIPVLRPAMMLEQSCEQVHGLSLMAWEGEDRVTLRDALGRGGVKLPKTNGSAPNARDRAVARPLSINLFIGPEGGFSAAEVAVAQSYGITTIGLGRRLLRAETASIVALALILQELGDLA